MTWKDTLFWFNSTWTRGAQTDRLYCVWTCEVPIMPQCWCHQIWCVPSRLTPLSGSSRVCVPMKPLITHCRTSALLRSALHRLKIIQDAEVGAFYQSGILGLGPNTGAGAQHSLLSAFELQIKVCSGFHREHLFIFSSSRWISELLFVMKAS